MWGRKKEAKPPKPPLPPISRWGHVVLIAWLIPGGGHWLQKRYVRGAILSFTITLTFLLGLMMRGSMFHPRTGDLLTIVIHVGGFLSDLAAGLLFLLTVWFGYSQPPMPGFVHDYGTKFLVAAGLMNVLAMVDAFEIAVGRKT